MHARDWSCLLILQKQLHQERVELTLHKALSSLLTQQQEAQSTILNDARILSRSTSGRSNKPMPTIVDKMYSFRSALFYSLLSSKWSSCMRWPRGFWYFYSWTALAPKASGTSDHDSYCIDMYKGLLIPVNKTRRADRVVPKISNLDCFCPCSISKSFPMQKKQLQIPFGNFEWSFSSYKM